MAVYKIPQDVEAEDKLIGPFTFRQFIFLIAAFISFWICFLLARISIVLIIFPLPFFLVFTLLGVYRRPDQPVEIYLLALLRFYFKPHARIWDPDGILQTVRITAPKVTDPRDRQLALSQGEVRNRLNQLADIMDTRGWSVKNVALQEGPATSTIVQSDRLVVPQAMPAEPIDIHQSDDLLYPDSPVAQNVTAMSNMATEQMRQQAVQQMYQAAGVAAPPVLIPSDGQADQPAQPQPIGLNDDASTSAMTEEATADILRLSQNNDLSVSTIARQAEQAAHRSKAKPSRKRHPKS